MYAEDAELDADQFRDITRGDYVAWCNDHKELWVDSHPSERIAAELGIYLEDIHAVEEAFTCGFIASDLLIPWWSILTLSTQKPVKRVPSMFCLNLKVVYGLGGSQEYGLQLDKATSWEGPITTGFFCSLLQDQMGSVIDLIAEHGMDKMYQEFASPIRASEPDV